MLVVVFSHFGDFDVGTVCTVHFLGPLAQFFGLDNRVLFRFFKLLYESLANLLADFTRQGKSRLCFTDIRYVIVIDDAFH